MATTSEHVRGTTYPPRRSGSRLVGLVSRVRELGLLVVLALILIIVGVQVPQFFTISNLVQILLSVSILAIVAVGETLVVLTRNVDLSVGSIVGFAAFVAADLFKQHPGTNLLLGILLGCALGLALGTINGLLVAAGRVPAIVATLGTLYVYRGLDFLYARGNQVSASDVPESFLSLATTPFLGIPVLAAGNRWSGHPHCGDHRRLYHALAAAPAYHTEAKMKHIWKFVSAWPWETLLVVLLLLTIVLGNALSPYFLTPFNFSLMVGAFVAIAFMALSLTSI